MSDTEPRVDTTHSDSKSTEAVLAVDVSGDLRFMLDQLPDGVIFMDEAWRITYANEQARRISRIRPEDLNSKSHWELYPATVGTEQERRYRRVMYERVIEEFEVYYEPFDVWIKLRALPIASGMAVYYQDVTELKRAQIEAASVTRRLEQVFDATSDAIAVLNREWRYTFLNQRAAKLLQPDGRELIGQTMWNMFPETVFPGSPFVENFFRTMNEGVSTVFEAYYPAPLNSHFQVECQPSPEGVVFFFRDITESKRAEKALRAEQAETERQRAELEAIYRTAPVGLILFEPKELRYLRINDRQTEMMGLSREEVLGRRVEEIVTSPIALENLRKVAAGGVVTDFTFETAFVGRPDETQAFNVNYSPVLDADGQVRAISVAALDVTKLRKAERALIQSEKLAAVGRLASSISHEINNPLEAVTNLLYLIATDEVLPPSLKPYVHAAQDELSRVSQIATQTLRFHRQSNKPTAVTPAQLVDAVLNLFAGRLSNSGIHVEASYSTATKIVCFENDIRQVLNNLIANAIDAMRTGGRLLARAHDAHHGGLEGVRILVADTGTGMSVETQRRLFEPFYTTKDLNGTGLGLWISKEIVDRHGGDLRVRSTQNGKMHGTVFSLFLPKEPPAVAASNSAPLKSPAVVKGEGLLR
ncbi:PAS domain S-box [Terriglobus roseus DSM 18391]|uniref:histidine kinase n=1 Tax=Terriglobus roseus (strain DSM 18391 / NRRL B-41598 / KBS 63) TaxID=926566 RepID=I3ZEX3_TERRK|nr:PAS domain S-box [Terriglobus roseus DSM 18391]